MKKLLILIAGLLLGFFIGRLWPFYSQSVAVIESGLGVHAIIYIDPVSRSVEIGDDAVITTEHILWYDWKSNVFALDSNILEANILDAGYWDQGYRFAIKIDGIVTHGLLYADSQFLPGAAGFVYEPTIFGDKVLFYGNLENLGGYDGSAARIYSIELPGLGTTLNTRIHTELEKEGLLLEQIRNRYILTEFDNIVGQSVESSFTVDYLSIITFTPTKTRFTNTDPIIARITDKNTGEIVTEFAHFASRPVSFIMDAGEYEIYVSGGGFVADSYIVSGIGIPLL